MKSRRKALKTLTSEKVVNISDYRAIRNGRQNRKLAVVTSEKSLAEGLKEQLKSQVDLIVFENRFSLEQGLKGAEWDGTLLDQRTLKDDTMPLCEKLKRQSKADDMFVVIVSDKNDKDIVRQGYEKGCDEWITRADDIPHLARLLSHHLHS